LTLSRGYKGEDWPKAQYYKGGKSLREMCRLEGVSQKTIANYMDKFGLARRPATNINHVKLSKEASEFLTGELLGDASIVWGNKPTSAYYTITSKHETYLKWIEAKLLSFRIARRGILRSYKNKYGTYWILQSKYYRDGLPILRRLWYPKGKKVVPQDIVLTPLTVKMWFIEDGSAIISNYVKSIELATNGFREEGVHSLITKLNDALETKRIYRTKANTIKLSEQSVIKSFYKYIGDGHTQIKDTFGYKWKLA
jgi:hypothetical protein